MSLIHKPRPLPERLKPYNRADQKRMLQAELSDLCLVQEPPKYDNDRYWRRKQYYGAGYDGIKHN